jgi:hypothetical protein
MLHLHPEVDADFREESGAVILSLAGGEEVRVTVRGGVPRLVGTTWHPEFGLSVPSVGLTIEFHGPELVTEFSWK